MSDAVKFYEHADYKANLDRWTTHKDLYEGDHSVLTQFKYLWPHEVESAANGGSACRVIREQLSRYLNLTEPVISTYQSLFFLKPMAIEESVKQMFGEDEIADVDGDGNGLQSFIKEKVLTSIFLYGKALILTDSYGIKAASKGKERELGLRPYFEILEPLQVKDWQIDQSLPGRKGYYDAIRCEYDLFDKRAHLYEEPTVTTYSKLLWLNGSTYTVTRYAKKSRKTAEQVLPSDGEWNLVDDAPIVGWDMLPVAALHSVPWIKDVAEQQLKLFNAESWHDVALHHQAYQRIYITGNLTPEQKTALTSFTVFFLPDGATMGSIEPGDLSGSRERIDSAIRNLYRVAFNKTLTLSSDSKESPGADTIREGKEELINLVKSTAGDIDDLMNEAIEHYARFKGVKNFKGKIKLNTDISTEDIDKQIALFAANQDAIRKVDIWHKSYLKKVAESQNLPNLDEILEAIDKGDFTIQPTISGNPTRDKIQARFGQVNEGNKGSGQPDNKGA